MTTGIYKITNLVNGKVYIGASKRIETRFWEHKRYAGSPIHSDLEAYGLENFKFEVLIECPEDMLCQWERDMICLYDSDDPEKGYNDKGAKPYSLKNSESHKGKPSWNKGIKTNRPAWNRGIPHSSETRRRISKALSAKDRTGSNNSNYGKRHPKEKLKWMTPNNEIRFMCEYCVKRDHPDWIRM